MRDYYARLFYRIPVIARKHAEHCLKKREIVSVLTKQSRCENFLRSAVTGLLHYCAVTFRAFFKIIQRNRSQRRGSRVASKVCLLRFFCIFLLIAPAAQAMTFKDLWWRPDQQAYDLLSDGDPAQAAQKFQDPMWKGVAEYRAGDFNVALSEFSKFNTEQGNYNRGNTLAQLGQYEPAIAAYDQALKQNPNDTDAKYNRDLVEKLLQQKQQQPQQQPQSNQGQNKKSPQNKDQASNKNQSQNQQQQNSKSQQNQDKSQSQSQQQNQQSGQQNSQQQQQQNQQQAQNNQNQNKPSQQNQQQAQAQAPKPQHYDQKQQAMQQWLQSIPDDPGGLLKQKFLRDHQRILASEAGS